MALLALARRALRNDPRARWCAVMVGLAGADHLLRQPRESIVAGERAGMARWRDHLFAYLARNAMPATAFFRIPDNRLIEIGRRVAI